MIKALLRSLLLLLILILAFITFLLTPMGLTFSVNIASKYLPGQLSYQKISGVIIGPITIDQLHYKTPEENIHIEKLRIDWRSIDLLKQQLHISSLDVHGLDIETPKNLVPNQWNEKTVQRIIGELIASIKNKIFSFHLIIDEAKLTKIQLINGNTKTQIKEISFHGLFTSDQWNALFFAVIDKPEPYDVRFSIKGKPTDYAVQFSIQGHQTNWFLMGKGNQQSLAMHTPHSQFLNGKLDSTLTINWDKTLQWQGQLTAQNINLSLLNPDWGKSFSIDIKSSGDSGKHLITNNAVHIQSSIGQLDFTAAFSDTWHLTWHLKLNAASDFYPKYKGNLESTGKVNGDLSNPAVDILINSQLRSDATVLKNVNIRIKGNFEKHTLLAKIAFNQAKINLILDGHLNHQDEWSCTLNQLQIALKDSGIWQLKKPSEITTIKDTTYVSPICLASPAAGNLCIKGKWENQKFTGEAVIHSREFEWVHELLPVARISGAQMNADFQISGTFKNPNITGSLHINEGSIFIRKINIILNQISASIIGERHILKVKVQAFSQHQPINLEGTVDLSKHDFTAQALITSDHALILNTDEYIVYANAKLTADIKNRNIIFSGNIDVPKAIIKAGDFRATVTLPDNDIIYVGNDIHPPKPFWLVQTDIDIILGNDISLNAAGFNTQMGGTIRLQQQPTRDMFATGKLFARKGIYTVYGQTLTITPDSSVFYTNSLLNDPTLDMRATKVISSVSNMGISGFTETNLVVGVHVTGSVKSPKITFISNRGNLSQANILSYILLGYGNTTNTPGNTDFLLRALSAVNISSQGLLGKQNIVSQIQEGLGLSEMGVEQETTVDALGNPLNRQSSFVVGKHLTRKFYARYSIGLLNPVNVFELRYLFDHHWSIQTDTSILGNGIDVMYTFDKN